MNKPIIAAITLTALFLLIPKGTKKEKQLNEIPDMYGENEARDALLTVAKIYGKSMAADIERLTRLETRHYKSGQFKKCGTPGMVIGKWTGLPSNLKTASFVVGGKTFTYYIWNPTDAFIYLAEYIKRNNGNWARWNSTDLAAQERYRKSVLSVTNKIII